MKKTLIIITLMATISSLVAQVDTLRNKEGGAYLFTKVKDLDVNDVQDQGRTGTCWTFSTLSFFESELMRMGKGKHHLSEMWIARNAYLDKADTYVRMHGQFNFSAGGAFHDIPYVIEKYGIVPESEYSGMNYGGERHNHAELDKILKAMVDVVVKNPQKKLTPSWKKAVEATADAYLGEVPESFEVEGKKYTPQSYRDHLSLNMDEYVAISSFTHHPFYEEFILEVPDNWAFGSFHNLPLDEMEEVMEYAVNNGYSFAWAADVSEKGFSFKNGLAIVPVDEDAISVKGKDSKNFNNAGADKLGSVFDTLATEKKITQEMRQEAFDNYETTDDHGMHVVGLYTDQRGEKFYLVKNSWGTKNDCDGYLFASTPYMRYKTMDILVHKDGIPKHIKKKLNIQ